MTMIGSPEKLYRGTVSLNDSVLRFDTSLCDSIDEVRQTMRDTIEMMKRSLRVRDSEISFEIKEVLITNRKFIKQF